MKMEGLGLCDIAMGSYDRAVICQLVGMFVLSLLSERYNKRYIGPNGDDKFTIFRGLSGHMAQCTKSDNLIARNTGGELNLKNWQFFKHTAKLKSANIYSINCMVHVNSTSVST